MNKVQAQWCVQGRRLSWKGEEPLREMLAPFLEIRNEILWIISKIHQYNFDNLGAMVNNVIATLEDILVEFYPEAASACKMSDTYIQKCKDGETTKPISSSAKGIIPIEYRKVNQYDTSHIYTLKSNKHQSVTYDVKNMLTTFLKYTIPIFDITLAMEERSECVLNGLTGLIKAMKEYKMGTKIEWEDETHFVSAKNIPHDSITALTSIKAQIFNLLDNVESSIRPNGSLYPPGSNDESPHLDGSLHSDGTFHSSGLNDESPHLDGSLHQQGSGSKEPSVHSTDGPLYGSQTLRPSDSDLMSFKNIWNVFRERLEGFKYDPTHFMTSDEQDLDSIFHPLTKLFHGIPLLPNEVGDQENIEVHIDTHGRSFVPAMSKQRCLKLMEPIYDASIITRYILDKMLMANSIELAILLSTGRDTITEVVQIHKETLISILYDLELNDGIFYDAEKVKVEIPPEEGESKKSLAFLSKPILIPPKNFKSEIRSKSDILENAKPITFKFTRYEKKLDPAFGNIEQPIPTNEVINDFTGMTREKFLALVDKFNGTPNDRNLNKPTKVRKPITHPKIQLSRFIRKLYPKEFEPAENATTQAKTVSYRLFYGSSNTHHDGCQYGVHYDHNGMGPDGHYDDRMIHHGHLIGVFRKIADRVQDAIQVNKTTFTSTRTQKLFCDLYLKVNGMDQDVYNVFQSEWDAAKVETRPIDGMMSAKDVVHEMTSTKNEATSTDGVHKNTVAIIAPSPQSEHIHSTPSTESPKYAHEKDGTPTDQSPESTCQITTTPEAEVETYTHQEHKMDDCTLEEFKEYIEISLQVINEMELQNDDSGAKMNDDHHGQNDGRDAHNDHHNERHSMLTHSGHSLDEPNLMPKGIPEVPIEPPIDTNHSSKLAHFYSPSGTTLDDDIFDAEIVAHIMRDFIPRLFECLVDEDPTHDHVRAFIEDRQFYTLYRILVLSEYQLASSNKVKINSKARVPRWYQDIWFNHPETYSRLISVLDVINRNASSIPSCLEHYEPLIPRLSPNDLKRYEEDTYYDTTMVQPCAIGEDGYLNLAELNGDYPSPDKANEEQNEVYNFATMHIHQKLNVFLGRAEDVLNYHMRYKERCILVQKSLESMEEAPQSEWNDAATVWNMPTCNAPNDVKDDDGYDEESDVKNVDSDRPPINENEDIDTDNEKSEDTQTLPDANESSETHKAHDLGSESTEQDEDSFNHKGAQNVANQDEAKSQNVEQNGETTQNEASHQDVENSQNIIERSSLESTSAACSHPSAYNSSISLDYATNEPIVDEPCTPCMNVDSPRMNVDPPIHAMDAFFTTHANVPPEACPLVNPPNMEVGGLEHPPTNQGDDSQNVSTTQATAHSSDIVEIHHPLPNTESLEYQDGHNDHHSSFLPIHYGWPNCAPTGGMNSYPIKIPNLVYTIMQPLNYVCPKNSHHDRIPLLLGYVTKNGCSLAGNLAILKIKSCGYKECRRLVSVEGGPNLNLASQIVENELERIYKEHTYVPNSVSEFLVCPNNATTKRRHIFLILLENRDAIYLENVTTFKSLSDIDILNGMDNIEYDVKEYILDGLLKPLEFSINPLEMPESIQKGEINRKLLQRLSRALVGFIKHITCTSPPDAEFIDKCINEMGYCGSDHLTRWIVNTLSTLVDCTGHKLFEAQPYMSFCYGKDSTHKSFIAVFNAKQIEQLLRMNEAIFTHPYFKLDSHTIKEDNVYYQFSDFDEHNVINIVTELRKDDKVKAPTDGSKAGAKTKKRIVNPQILDPQEYRHPKEFQNPSEFLNLYGDPLCSALSNPPTNTDINVNGNWECRNCKNINFPRRTRCNRCREIRSREGDKIVFKYAMEVYQRYTGKVEPYHRERPHSRSTRKRPSFAEIAGTNNKCVIGVLSTKTGREEAHENTGPDILADTHRSDSFYIQDSSTDVPISGESIKISSIDSIPNTRDTSARYVEAAPWRITRYTPRGGHKNNRREPRKSSRVTSARNNRQTVFEGIKRDFTI